MTHHQSESPTTPSVLRFHPLYYGRGIQRGSILGTGNSCPRWTLNHPIGRTIIPGISDSSDSTQLDRISPFENFTRQSPVSVFSVTVCSTKTGPSLGVNTGHIPPSLVCRSLTRRTSSTLTRGRLSIVPSTWRQYVGIPWLRRSLTLLEFRTYSWVRNRLWN